MKEIFKSFLDILRIYSTQAFVHAATGTDSFHDWSAVLLMQVLLGAIIICNYGVI